MPSDREQAAMRVACAVATHAGFDACGAVVHRIANSVLVRLPAAGVMVRVDRQDRAVMATGHVAVARLLEDLGVPAARLAVPGAEPRVTPSGVVTLWWLIEFEERYATPEELGAAARTLHDATAGIQRTNLPMLVPFVEIALWLESAAACGSPRISELQGLATQLLARWDATAASGSFAEVIVHGDLNRDNVVITVDGPVLLDLECAGYGPVAWDLVAQWVAVRRYGRARSEYDRFCAVYGDDVRASPRFDLLLQVYELSLTAWALAQSEQSPQMRSESAVRVRGLLDSARGEWSLL